MKHSKVEPDDITSEISRVFDYEFDGTTSFKPLEISPLDLMSLGDDWKIGLIVGPSGSGKSTLLREFGEEQNIGGIRTKQFVLISNDATDAEERLSSVGFNSIPSWMRPYHVLSNGEQFRADLARGIEDGAIIDEYTSVVDRNVCSFLFGCCKEVHRQEGSQEHRLCDMPLRHHRVVGTRLDLRHSLADHRFTEVT